jgi:radical SAM enzyme (TIGR01210 family)
MNATATYPSGRAGRDRFVLERRPLRLPRDPWRHQGVLVEDERAVDGTTARVATIFLTGRECPWRCVMCDLWQHTILDDTPRGALLKQLDDALAALGAQDSRPGHVKLYNASNFFDPRAVPEHDYDGIAARLLSFRHVIVESHPALIGERLVRFSAALARAAGGADAPSLEVAMGLETANPDALRALNKGFTLEQFARAADRLRREGASLRAFLLVGVPFIDPSEQLEWTARSVSFAFDCGASVVSLIPTRPGNGTLEALGAVAPTIADLETAFERALTGAAGRVFADLWDLDRFAGCRSCSGLRESRIRRMNLEQRVHPSISCVDCGSTSGQAA